MPAGGLQKRIEIDVLHHKGPLFRVVFVVLQKAPFHGAPEPAFAATLFPKHDPGNRCGGIPKQAVKARVNGGGIELGQHRILVRIFVNEGFFS